MRNTNQSARHLSHKFPDLQKSISWTGSCARIVKGFAAINSASSDATGKCIKPKQQQDSKMKRMLGSHVKPHRTMAQKMKRKICSS